MHDDHDPALEPEDLGRLFLQRANAGDVEGVVQLYEPDAVLAFPPGELTVGRDGIRAAYATLLADPPAFDGPSARPSGWATSHSL